MAILLCFNWNWTWRKDWKRLLASSISKETHRNRARGFMRKKEKVWLVSNGQKFLKSRVDTWEPSLLNTKKKFSKTVRSTNFMLLKVVQRLFIHPQVIPGFLCIAKSTSIPFSQKKIPKQFKFEKKSCSHSNLKYLENHSLKCT